MAAANAYSTARGGGGSSAGASSMGVAGQAAQAMLNAETYRATKGDLRSLFSKIEAHAPHNAQRMRSMYDASLRLVDIWKPPPVPVVCVIGSGQPTHVGYGYMEAWPKNMGETPCPMRYEDGDMTVPVRSSETICRHWQKQKKCHSPLSTAQQSMYKGKSDECVEIVYMHCKSANMESADLPRGVDHCTDLHSKILHKLPVIDLVQSIALNNRAFEPGYAASIEQIDEFSQLLAWLHNSGADRLPSDIELSNAFAAAGVFEQPPNERDWAVGVVLKSVESLRSRDAYVEGLERLQQLIKVARRRVLQHSVRSPSSGAMADPSDDSRTAGAAASSASETDASASTLEAEMEAALDSVSSAIAPVLSSSASLSGALEAITHECEGTTQRGRGTSVSNERVIPTQQQQPQTPWTTMSTEEAAIGTCGLPDCSDAYEQATYSSLRSSTYDEEAQRKESTERKKRMCRVKKEMRHLEPRLDEMREQVEWCAHHWRKLHKRLSSPEPTPEGHKIDPGEYESSLYGHNKERDHLLAS